MWRTSSGTLVKRVGSALGIVRDTFLLTLTHLTYLNLLLRLYLFSVWRPMSNDATRTLLTLLTYFPSLIPYYHFSVWRPVSNDAIRKMWLGEGVGKSLNIKGKSAKCAYS